MRNAGQMKAAVILLILHVATTRTAKNNAPSVHEVINEQARIDDKRPLPYGNPLAGNSLQNAKLHAQHQQAMFNAERVRQHRAQLQRWNKAPLQVDSYMKAYRESQESHHLALEQMQAAPKERKAKRPERPERPERSGRPERPNLKNRPQLEPIKITRADAVDKSRNHRSYGSVHYAVQKKRKINTSPGPTYDQGVTIRPNGNVGLNNNLEREPEGLYTSVVPSKTQYVYPKLYSQMHSYQSADDIHALNTLLAKQPQEQLSSLNTLLYANKEKENNLEKPIDLFFYLNDPNVGNKYSTQNNNYNGPYATEFVNYEDHKPITEEVDDIEDDRKDALRVFPPATPSTMAPVYEDPTTTKSNYYKIEVEQTISANKPKNVEFTSQEKPHYSALTYEKPLTYYPHEPSAEGVKYLHPQQSGVQHLSHDGTGVSAYGDDDIHYAANYEFGYRVRDHETGNDFGHQEAKSGDSTQGQYHVLLPDGRLQQVRYSAGPEGFHADISYDHLQASI